MKLKPKMSVASQRALLYKRYTDLESTYTENNVYLTDDQKLWLFDRDSESFIELTEEITQKSYIQVHTNPIQTLLTFKGKYYGYSYSDSNYGWQRQLSPTIEQITPYNKSDTSITLYVAKNQFLGYYFVGADNEYQAIEIETTNIINNKILINGIEKNVIIKESKEYTLYEIENYTYKVSWNGKVWNLNDTRIIPQHTTLTAKFSNVANKYQLNRYYYVSSFSFMFNGDIESTLTQPIKGSIMPLTSLNIKYYDDTIELKEGDFVVIDKRLYQVENPTSSLKLQPKPYKIHFATLNSIV